MTRAQQHAGGHVGEEIPQADLDAIFWDVTRLGDELITGHFGGDQVAVHVGAEMRIVNASVMPVAIGRTRLAAIEQPPGPR